VPDPDACYIQIDIDASSSAAHIPARIGIAGDAAACSRS